MKALSSLICFLILTYFLGCAPTLKGDIFKEIGDIPNDESVIFIYWTNAVDEKCKAEFSLKVNRELITDMAYGGYFKYSTSEDFLTFETHVNFKFMVVGALDAAMVNSRKLSGNALPGKVYFVRCSLIRLNSAAPGQLQLAMKSVDKKRGLYEIRGAKLIVP